MISIKNVSKWYGTFQVLTDCSTEVKKGEVVVVCGPSGSGKSTLIKCVNALEPFQRGEILVDGILVGAPGTDLPKLRSRIGMGWWMTMRRVVLPQAVRIVLPPYGNVMIMMLKDSSQASTITVAELALQGKLIASSTFKNASVFTLVALMYLTMSIPLILLVRHFEKRAGKR